MIHRHDNGAVCVRQHLRRPAGVADIIKQLRQPPVDRRVVQRQLDAVCEQRRTALCQCGRVGVACQTAVIGVLHGEIPPAAPLEQNVQSGTHIYPRQAGMPVAACIGNQPRQVDGIVEHDLQLCHAGTGCQDILQLFQQVRTDAASPVVRLDAQEGKVPAGAGGVLRAGCNADQSAAVPRRDGVPLCTRKPTVAYLTADRFQAEACLCVATGYGGRDAVRRCAGGMVQAVCRSQRCAVCVGSVCDAHRIASYAFSACIIAYRSGKCKGICIPETRRQSGAAKIIRRLLAFLPTLWYTGATIIKPPYHKEACS